MSELQDRMQRAREASSFQTPQRPAKKQGGKRKPKVTTATRPAPDTAAQTANAAARADAGIEPGGLSRAEKQALRRQEIAHLSVEISRERKAELLAAAEENGRSLRAEVLHRLGFDDDE